jgi:ribonuclease P protein component
MEIRRTPIFTLGKNERLKNRKPIEALFQKGDSIKTTSFILLYQKSTFQNEPSIKMMFIVSKKNYGLAHDRNQIKRWMREAYRTQKLSILKKVTEKQQSWDAGIMYTGKKLPNFDYVQSKIKELLMHWEAKIAESE